jgi:hypothetical protein
MACLIATQLGAVWLARRNVKLGRGDVRGARRTTFIVVCFSLLSWILGSRHLSNASTEFTSWMMALGMNAPVCLLIWLSYLVLEPYVRRIWPEMLITWTRILFGRWRDSRVGRDLLIGAIAGLASTILLNLGSLWPRWRKRGVHWPWPTIERQFPSGLEAGSVLAQEIAVAIGFTFFLLFTFFLIRYVVRRDVLAFGLMLIVFGVTQTSVAFGSYYLSDFVWAGLSTALLLTVLYKLGFFATAVAVYYESAIRVFGCWSAVPSWFGEQQFILLLLIFAPVAFGFWLARAGRPLFREAPAPQVAAIRS